MQTFVGDTVYLIVETGVDLTSLTTRYLKFRRPDGTTGKWSVSFDGSNETVMTCHLSNTDLDMAGVWAIQAYAAVGTEVYHGDFVSFTVDNKIPLTTAPPTTVAPTTLP